MHLSFTKSCNINSMLCDFSAQRNIDCIKVVISNFPLNYFDLKENFSFSRFISRLMNIFQNIFYSLPLSISVSFCKLYNLIFTTKKLNQIKRFLVPSE